MSQTISERTRAEYQDPDQDGKSHINIYSRGHTTLGRWLSDFAQTPVETAEGPFESLEGWWYWQLTQRYERDRLRKLWGHDAKRSGQALGAPDWPPTAKLPSFQIKFEAAARAKLEQNPEMTQLLTESSLPLTHYYCWGKPRKIHAPQEAEWITAIWETLRAELKATGACNPGPR